MNPATPDPATDKLLRALDAYATELDRLAPSAQLDARMRQAIHSELSSRRRSQRWRPSATWAIAASVALLVATSVLMVRNDIRPEAPARSLAPDAAQTAMQVFPAGAASLWPTEATVFRVRGNVGGPNSGQQYWLDVRMGNDGSMRIERVLSADGSELFVRPGTDP